MTDMEGCAGVLNFDDWTGPGGRYFENGKRLLTEEVNAAIEGLCEGGVSEILVVDGHGAGGIDPELLDPRVELMRGHAEKVALWGLDKTFDGLGFVGQHAKAGTPYSHMTHTQWCNYIDLAINGVSIGEYGQIALCAMELGVPTILACGEKAFAAEAQALAPGVLTAAVKRGLLPDGLDHLDTDAYKNAKLSAIHLAPKHACALIRKAAIDAAHKLQKDPSSFRYPKMSPPYVRTARFRKFGDRPAWSARDEHPSSITELMDMPFTPA
jgi:D-aminopeptidase